MDKCSLRTCKRAWIFALVAVSYILISNYDTYDLPEFLSQYLGIVSFVVSFVGGFLFFTSIFPLVLTVVRLIRHQRLGRTITWSLFIAALFFIDMAVTRQFFLGIARERSISRAEPLIAAIEQCRHDSGSYPKNLICLVPTYIEQVPKLNSHDWREFRYENLDSTYQLGFTQWQYGRTYQTLVYTPTGTLEVPIYAKSDVYEAEQKNWKYFY